MSFPSESSSRNTIALTPPPRDPAAARRLRFHAGLGPYYFFGSLFLVGLWVPMAMAIHHEGWKTSFLFPLILFGTIGVAILFRARRRHRSRVRAFCHGELCVGTVRERKKTFVFWKSSRDHLIKVDVTLPDGTKAEASLQTSDASIARSMGEGANVQVLFERSSGSALFPIESRVTLTR